MWCCWRVRPTWAPSTPSRPASPWFIEVPTDDIWHDHGGAGKILATTERVKMIYVIPDFQNPTGRTGIWTAATGSWRSSTAMRSQWWRITPTASCGSRVSPCPR